VARLLVNDRLHHLEQRLREEARAARHLEQAEGEERVDALAIPGVDEGLFEVRGQGGTRARLDGDGVAIEHHLEQPRVPLLLVTLERDRLAQDGIGHGLSRGAERRRGTGGRPG
jgi:hypothetical protein